MLKLKIITLLFYLISLISFVAYLTQSSNKEGTGYNDIYLLITIISVLLGYGFICIFA